MIDFFQMSGTVQVSKDSWNSRCHAGVNSSAHVFSKKAHIPSGPVALLVFIVLNTLVTEPESIFILMTKDETQLQYLLQIVQKHRQDYPDSRKETLIAK